MDQDQMSTRVKGASSFWVGFKSIFSWGSLGRTKQMEKILRESKERETWYHEGPWWKHPYWNGVWDKDK